MITFQIQDQLPKNSIFALSTLSIPLKFNLTARKLLLSRLDGYPRATFAIGRIQDAFNTAGDMTDLQTSMLVLRDCALTAAQALMSAEGTKMDKAPMSDSDIATYVQEIIRTNRFQYATMAQVDIILSMVTSWETDPNSWTLINSSSVDESLHCQFERLYTSVALETGIPNDQLPLLGADDQITTLHNSPIFASLLATGASGAFRAQLLADTAAQIRFGLMLQLDHIHSLLMSRDIWYTFMHPRYDGKSAAANLDRAKGLETFATYLQNVLLIPQLASFEMVMYATELLQDIAKQRVILEPNVEQLLNTVREYDTLEVRSVVIKYLDEFTKNADGKYGKTERVLPQELIRMTLPSLTIPTTPTGSPASVNIADLSQLSPFNGGEMFRVLAGQPIAEWNFRRQLTDFLLFPSLMNKYVRDISFMLYQVTDVLKDPRVRRLVAALSFRSPIPWIGDTVLVPEYAGGVRRKADDTTLIMDPLAGSVSVPFNDFIRYKESYLVVNGSTIHEQYQDMLTNTDLTIPGLPPHIVPNVDRPVDLVMTPDIWRLRRWQTITGLKGHTLVPSAFVTAEVWTAEEIRTSHTLLKQIIQKVTQSYWETVSIQLSSVPYLTDFATKVSSFALVYVRQNERSFVGDPTLANNVVAGGPGEIGTTAATLLPGHGQPYGMTYEALAALQPAEYQITLLADGVYLRFLDRIPGVSTTLARGFQAYDHSSFPYYAAGVDVYTILRWGFGEVGFNFCLFNIDQTNVPANTNVYTLNNVYPGDNYYMNLSPRYTADEKKGRVHIPIKVETKAWPYRRVYDAEHRVVGQYGQPAVIHKQEGTEESKDPITTAVQAQIDQDILARMENKTNQENVTAASKNVAAKVERHVDERAEKLKANADRLKDDADALTL